MDPIDDDDYFWEEIFYIMLIFSLPYLLDRFL